MKTHVTNLPQEFSACKARAWATNIIEKALIVKRDHTDVCLKPFLNEIQEALTKLRADCKGPGDLATWKADFDDGTSWDMVSTRMSETILKLEGADLQQDVRCLKQALGRKYSSFSII